MVVLPTEGEDLWIFRVEELQGAPARSLESFSIGDDAFHPPEEGGGVPLLVFHIDGLVVVLGVDDDRKVELLRVGGGKTGISIRAPLHGRPHAIPVPEIVVITHPDLIAVIDHRQTRNSQVKCC